VDYRTARIIFSVPEAPAYDVTFSSGPPLVSVPMALNGTPMQMLVDTGASSLMIFKARWPRASSERAFFVRPKEQSRYSTNVGGEFERQRLTLKGVVFGTMEMGRQTAFLVDDRQDAQGQFDGLFNPVLLGLEQICFDFARNRLRWKR
jgi:aspartyl protease